MREDGRVIYTMASVVDDVDHGITHIIRGEDHVTNSAAQIQLFEALGAKAPTMGHMALLAGADGEGLSKRIGSLSIGELRTKGIEPVAIASLLSRIGTADPVEAQADMTSIIDGFNISRFARATAKFDIVELEKVNGQIIQDMPFDIVKDQLAASGVGGGALFWETVRGNITFVSEAKIWWDICTCEILPIIDSKEVTKAAAVLLPAGPVDASIWKIWTNAIATETGIGGKGLFMPLRLALTGRDSGPELASMLAIMGRDRILARLNGVPHECASIVQYPKREKENFIPIDPAHVRVYACGPTVYGRIHVGNARPIVVFDVLVRLLRLRHAKVTYVRNITDVDDKINIRAAERGISINDLCAETIKIFHHDTARLGSFDPDIEPRATHHIDEMQAMITTLIEKGHAYEADGHVLFQVSTMDAYGALSKRSMDDMIAGARVEVASYKREAADFILWKPSNDDQPGWNSPWGRGTPGLAYRMLGNG